MGTPVQIDPTYRQTWGLGWLAAEPAYMRRASHALAADDGVWLVNPVDGEGLADLIAPLGRVRGVVQLLDRHPRDCAALARRHGVPHLVTPTGGVPGAPFDVIVVADRPWWREVALWWAAPRVLVVAESLGTAPYYLAPGAAVGVHPLMRMTPPRALGAHRPAHLLTSHGAPPAGDVAEMIGTALARSRRDIPRVLRRMAVSRLRPTG